MSLRALLTGVIVIAIAITAGLGLATWSVSGQLARLHDGGVLADRIAHDVSKLLVLTNELALHGEDRSFIQWRAYQRQIVAALQATPEHETQQIVQLVAEAGRLGEFMRRLAAAKASPLTTRHDIRVGLLTDQLLIHTQAFMDSVHRWSKRMDAEHDVVEERLKAIAVGIPIMLLLGLTGFSLIILRRILQPLAQLNTAMAAVANGDMTARSGILGDDELGRVSQAFDALAIDLVNQLRQSEERQASALQILQIANKVADIGVWVWDIRAGTLTWDQEMFDIYGVPEALRATTLDYSFWSSRLHPQDLPMAEAKLKAQVEGTGLYDPTFRVIRPDGSERYVQAAAFMERDASGTLSRMVGINSDITQSKQDELARQKYERELGVYREHLERLVAARTAEATAARVQTQLILDSSADGLIGLDVQGNVTLCNPSALMMLGYQQEDLLGYNVHDVIHYKHPDGHAYPADQCAVIQAIRDGRVIRIEEDVFWDVDGNPIPVSVATHPIFEQGRTVGGVMNFRDISDRLRAEAAREEARQAAEHLARVKSEFLANMSHEIRTPLNGVLGLAQIGYRDNSGNSKTQETFARILDSGKLLLTIINDILDFSKIEAGKLNIESVPLDPAHLVDEAISALEVPAVAKSLKLTCAKAPDLPLACLGDPIRIAQILLNLLSNAVKFTLQGEVRLSAHREDHQLIFQVTDSGIGIPPEHIDRLFMPFEQADGTTTRKFGGTGLGLAISRRLADMMGGSLTVTSEVGHGSIFTLTLPLRITEQAVTRDIRSSSSGQQRLTGLRILAANDNPVNQLVLENFLNREGAEVTMVSDGQQAVEAVKRGGAFDAVLMDIQMPVMDGIEATRNLRQISPNLPIIGQTAHAMKEEHDKCLAAGMVATITKPIDVEILVATVLGHIRTPNSKSTVPPPVPDATPPPATDLVIDWAALANRYPSHPEFIDRLVMIAIQSHGNDVELLHELIVAGDIQEIGKIAHALKGMAGNIHAPELEKTAIQVMHAAKANSTDDALAQAAYLADAVERLMFQLKLGKPG